MEAEQKDKVLGKKPWVAPELTSIQGLDSCVEFLYTGSGGTPGGDPNPNLPPNYNG